jgi:hypothetical protein
LKTFFANHELGDIFQSYVKPKWNNLNYHSILYKKHL